MRAALRHSDQDQADELLDSLLRSNYPDAIIIGLRCLRQKDQKSGLRPDDDLGRVRDRRLALPRRSLQMETLESLLEKADPEWVSDLACMVTDLTGPRGPASLAKLITVNPKATSTVQKCLLLDAYQLQYQFRAPRRALARSLEACMALPAVAPSDEALLAAVVLRSADLTSPGLPADGQNRIRLNVFPSHVLLALQKSVRQARSRPIRRALISLLDCDVLGDSALEALESARPPQLASILSESGHLLTVSNRRRHLLGSRVPTRLAGLLRKTASIDPALLRHAPSLLMECHEDHAVVASRLGVIGTSGDSLARFTSLACLRHMDPSPERQQALLDIQRSLPPAPGPCMPSTGRVTLQQLESLLATLPPWKAAACSVIHHTERPDALASMLRRVLGSRATDAICSALEIIDRRDLAPDFEPQLLQLAQARSDDESDQIRGHCIRLLAHGRSSDSARAILRALADPSPVVQQSALQSATSIKCSESVKLGCHVIDASLLERLARTSDSRIRRVALRALRDRDDAAFRALLGSLFEGKTVRERLAAIDGARFSGEHELSSRVLRLLEDPSSDALRETGRIALRSLRASRAKVPAP